MDLEAVYERDRQFLSATQVADLLAVSPQSIARLIQSGALEGYRVGPRSLRISADAVDRFLERSRVASLNAEADPPRPAPTEIAVAGGERDSE